MFAQHYAHDYYVTAIHGEHGGLDFPGGQAPDYGDFIYFATLLQHDLGSTDHQSRLRFVLITVVPCISAL
jgi:uncharacterized membrane protein